MGHRSDPFEARGQIKSDRHRPRIAANSLAHPSGPLSAPTNCDVTLLELRRTRASVIAEHPRTNGRVVSRALEASAGRPGSLGHGTLRSMLSSSSSSLSCEQVILMFWPKLLVCVCVGVEVFWKRTFFLKEVLLKLITTTLQKQKAAEAARFVQDQLRGCVEAQDQIKEDYFHRRIMQSCRRRAGRKALELEERRNVSSENREQLQCSNTREMNNETNYNKRGLSVVLSRPEAFLIS